LSLSEATGLVQRIQSLWRRYSHVNWALADQALISGINFAMGILLARFMGIEEFGLFAMAWLFIEFAGIFQQAIIVMPMMSIGPKQTKADMAGYLGATVLQQFAFLAVVIVCLTAGTFILRRVSPNIDLTQLLLPLAAAACAARHKRSSLGRTLLRSLSDHRGTFCARARTP